MDKNQLLKIALVWFLLLPVVVDAQEISDQFSYADSLFNNENYFESITEFKRLLFFDKNKKYSFSANYKIGLAYKYGAKYDDAIRFLKIAQENYKLPDEKTDAKLMIIRTNILRGTEDIALKLLVNLETNSTNYSENETINYWRGWAYMFKDDWENASLSFAKIKPDHELKLICDKVINEKYSVTFAKVISYILPGFGQFYTGHYLSGLLSIGWNFLWGYTTITAFTEDRIFDGLVIANLLWFRFYRGNFQNAEKFAKQENIKIANKTLQKVQKEYRGLKP